jgi:hypothetical protein
LRMASAMMLRVEFPEDRNKTLIHCSFTLGPDALGGHPGSGGGVPDVTS